MPDQRQHARTTPDDWVEATLLLAAHGSAFEGGRNHILHRHAEAIAKRFLFARVQPVALNGSPSLDDALSGVATKFIYIGPLFMSAGKLANGLSSDVASRLSKAGPTPQKLYTCPPLGTWSEITDLIELRAAGLATKGEARPDETSILVVGHGSTHDPAANDSLEWHADRLRRRMIFQNVNTAYLEGEPQASHVVRKLRPPAVVVGFFAGGDCHASEDLPQLVETHAPHARLSGAIGEDDLIPDILLSQVAGCSESIR